MLNLVGNSKVNNKELGRFQVAQVNQDFNEGDAAHCLCEFRLKL